MALTWEDMSVSNAIPIVTSVADSMSAAREKGTDGGRRSSSRQCKLHDISAQPVTVCIQILFIYLCFASEIAEQMTRNTPEMTHHADKCFPGHLTACDSEKYSYDYCCSSKTFS